MSDAWFFEVLPNRPPPFADECLSGYLLRLAHANGFTIFWDLISELFPSWRRPQQISMLLWEYPLAEWGRIPLRIQLPVAALNRLTVAPWIEKFRSPPDLTCSIYFSPGHFLKGVVHHGLCVCPLCLQEQPYIRLPWRLAPVTACVKHGCLLQDHCSTCGSQLTAAEQASQYMRCSSCRTDLRILPVVPITDEILEKQTQLFSSVSFLLDPLVTLTKGVGNLSQDENCLPAELVGLKFHYLRSQLGFSIQSLTRKLGVPHGVLSALEQGGRPPFRLYLTYLEALSQSWPALAALQVPTEFLLQLQTQRHYHLRLCPNPACPNHQPQTNPRVILLADLPERQAARFHCKDCGQNFTRSYDGKLLTKTRRPLIRPGEPPTVPKPAEAIAILKTWGLQGDNNRQIAHRLGWGEKTVRMYWIALDIEKQVHQAQSLRREKEKQERISDFRTRLERILPTLLNTDEMISLRQIDRTLGLGCDYLHSRPDLTAWVQSLIRSHNVRVRQKQKEDTTSRIMQALDEMKSSNRLVKAAEIAQKAGLTYSKLRENFPELLLILHQALVEHRSWLQALQLKTQIEQIDAAASRLTANGVRLNYKVILQEAGLSSHSSNLPPIRDALLRWMGVFAPRD